jgi:hypothetical protein
MGYGYVETFLIVFLTHPGVVIPESFMTGFPPIMTGLWQVLWYWILGLPGERSAGLAWTMYVIYLIFLGLYAYFFLSIRLQKGI